MYPPAALSDAVFSTPARLVGGPAPLAPAPPQPGPKTRKVRPDLEYLAGGDRWGSMGGYLRLPGGSSLRIGWLDHQHTTERKPMRFADLTGRRFGRLTVLSHEKGMCSCRCDCGGSKTVRSAFLRNGAVVSCGCRRREASTATGKANKKDLTGRKFGRLTVIGPAPNLRGLVRWACKCECGNEKVVQAGRLTDGRVSSCGCQLHWTLLGRNATHCESDSPLYRTWNGMMGRCYRPSSPRYHNYGGRGIAVCLRWRESPAAFEADMGLPPSPGLSIDRIDNEGGYWCGKCAECLRAGRPANCRWATVTQQGRNKRTNRLITWEGEARTLTDWAKPLGISTQSLAKRIDKGWPLSRALTEPPRTGNGGPDG